MEVHGVNKPPSIWRPISHLALIRCDGLSALGKSFIFDQPLKAEPAEGMSVLQPRGDGGVTLKKGGFGKNMLQVKTPDYQY